MLFYNKVEELLTAVEKPSRYSGGELNRIIKTRESVKARMAFCFPDTYEVGMSHLGMKILYHAVNSIPKYSCERVFAPWIDMEKAMRESGVPLFSLETRTPVADFDLIAFTLQYEMSYTNILNILDLAGVPLYSKDRRDGAFVVAGGPCAFSPEPLADFIDVFVLGDGEEAIVRLMDTYSCWRDSGGSREDFLLKCANTPGMYVPALYSPSPNFGNVTRNRPDAPEIIVKNTIEDIDAATFPDSIVVPYAQIVHDRIMLEIARGCTRGCRFCQAGYIYRPARERRLKTLIDQAEKLIDSTGYEEISLSSLSSGDYSCLPELTANLVKKLRNRHVSVSLPSLRIDSVVKDSLVDMAEARKSSLTFAPEAGTQRLRDVINKNVTHDDLIRSLSDAYAAGYTSVKLYFMIGLPTETYEDLDGIAILAREARELFYKAAPPESRRRAPKVSVSASVFVPKPHTAFQFCAQDSAQEIEKKQSYLRTAMKRVKGVDFKWHDPAVSVLEAAFARGDRRLGRVLAKAAELGCRFDGWSDQFRPDIWIRAFEECGISLEEYSQRQIGLSDPLPWDHISSGVSRQYLAGEYERALEGGLTPDCRGGCTGCGVSEHIDGGCPLCAV